LRLIIVSGLSGSGKSVALNLLEDMGFYCIDNVPAMLVEAMVSQIAATDSNAYENLAMGVDARNRSADLDSVPDMARRLRDKGVQCEVVFLHADDDILLKRYSETRRRHPMRREGASLKDAIALERELLGPIIAAAELVIDTTRTSIYQLRDTLSERVGLRQAPNLSILVESFGFKHGLPADADFVFDLRCLPNPYWEPTLRPLTGLDPAVAKFLDGSAAVQDMYADILAFLKTWIPRYKDFHRNYLTVALGCTGGQHRSVYMVQKIAAALSEQHPEVLTRHTELPADEAAGGTVKRVG
jgi:UPF0042 nucleotide-binding protein